MGLGDIIDGIHGPGELLPLLDTFLTTKEPDDRSGWHPSQFCGMCPRAYVLKKILKQDKREIIGAQLQRIFDTGHAMHYWYQNEYFGPMGILWGPWKCRKCGDVEWGMKPKYCSTCNSRHFLYMEIPIQAKIPDCTEPINGHADGLIRIQNRWYVLEIKTINSNAFKWLKGAKELHIQQAQIYAELIRQRKVKGVPFGVKVPDPEGIIFLYIAKDTSELKEYNVPTDSDFGRHQIQNPRIAEIALAKKELPERLSECTGLSAARAKKCGIKDRCFGKWEYEDLVTIGLNN